MVLTRKPAKQGRSRRPTAAWARRFHEPGCRVRAWKSELAITDFGALM
jgi:hypothetical protein